MSDEITPLPPDEIPDESLSDLTAEKILESDGAQAASEREPAPESRVEFTEEKGDSSSNEPADREVERQNHTDAVLAESRRYTRRAFAVGAAAVAAGYGLHRWIASGDDMMQPTVLRRAFQANAAISRTIFDERSLAPTYPQHLAEELRVNGVYGLKQALVPESWRLQLVGVRDAAQHSRFSPDVTSWTYRYATEETKESKGHDTKVAPASDTAEKMSPASMLERERERQNRTARMPRGQEEAGESRSTLPTGTPGLLLTLDDILKLPRHELVTQFKCIEGWSQIVHWAGVRMSDFLEAYPPEAIDKSEPKYVYMETPNGDYYTGYNIDICRHPQTLLVTEMMGTPLTQYHGAPLRLHLPTKYGYKQIKRIGLIHYTSSKPDDYWTKLGYDWYAGL